MAVGSAKISNHKSSTEKDEGNQQSNRKLKKSRSKQLANNINEFSEKKSKEILLDCTSESMEIRQKLQDKLKLLEKVKKVSERPSGDGESLPETPPNESSPSPVQKPEVRAIPSRSKNVFAVQLEVDLMAAFILLVGTLTRLYRLDEPRNVVFDEMHYGKYAAKYIKNTFFFDSSPPLGKLLIALSAYIAGFDGNFEFTKIGASYNENTPIWALRFIPAFCGSLLVPTVYCLLNQLKFSQWTGALAAFLVLFDTAILAQSRFILMESIMMFFAVFALYSLVKFNQLKSQPYSVFWWIWLILCTSFMTAAFCVKYIGFYTCLLCIGLLVKNFCSLLPTPISNKQLLVEFLTRISVLTAIPTIIYFGVFYIHLDLLSKAGNHDSLMTSAFQASLEGGLGSIIRGQPLTIAHGSQITLRHTHGRTCWLHSHEAVYPIRYGDGRGSSHQQQVTCYSFKDVNNWWIVKRPDRDDLAVHEPIDSVRHGDEIQLVHGMSHRALNSHDVAAPVTPQCQEVSCYIDYNISMPAETLWRVDIVNREQVGDVWHSVESQVRLIHVNTSQALRFSGRQLPDWAFNQHEVVADKLHGQVDTVWNVEEHRYTKSDKDQKTMEREIMNAELIPEKPTHLSFLDKFVELQVKMLISNYENIQNHNYASDPSEWPFLTRGIAYYISQHSNAQVHLIGNIVSWYTGTLSIIVYCSILVFYLLRRRRLCFDISEKLYSQFIVIGEIFLSGYLVHYLPFYFYDHTLFLHHYLPALLFKFMLTAALFEHIYLVLAETRHQNVLKFFVALLVVWMCAVVVTFYKFSVLSYGFVSLASDDVMMLKLKDTWDLIIHKH